ncbi:hypothetical protein L873DRAFT_1731135 [Choiromyces venosus 120613-1]|uniref:Uncharacterized protein n=1 Tax=Choiromyces venosus 120613-1 TaxID=1336337 RepID=A0A3N4JYU7_9PEZI|nr:hypothetical protein L873DRAFT_1731135 [Choiromyces venosus 120613-1]
MFNSQMACPDCRTTRTPDDDKAQASATIKALVHNFQTLAILLDSASSAGQTEILIGNIKDALTTSFSSCLLKVGNDWQLPEELVQNTIGVLDQFHVLSSRPPRRQTSPQREVGATRSETFKRSHHPLEAWSPLKKRTSSEFYYLASMQALERLKDLKSEDFRDKERDKVALIAQIKNLVCCADPSGGLEKMITEILSDPKRKDIPSEETKLSPIQEGIVDNLPRFIWPDALEEYPIPSKTPHLSPKRRIELSPTGNRNMRFPDYSRPLSPLLPPSLIVSEDFQGHLGQEKAQVPSILEKCDVLTMIRKQKKITKDTAKVIPEDLQPDQPHSGLIFNNWAAINLTSFTDLYKPVLFDYLPIRDIPKEDSSVLIIDSGATPFTFTAFWRNLNLTKASEIFRWMNVYRRAALDVVDSFKKDLSSHDNPSVPRGDSWIPLRYPRIRFIRDMHAGFRQMYGKSSWSEAEVIRLLNTCGTCRSLTIESFSKPSHISDTTGRPLLHFSIKFDGISVIFQDFLRQIVVPVSQTYTSPGQTLIITPVLYDPHQVFDDLSTKTGFEVSSQFSWLRWDQVLQGFLGIVPESLLAEAHTKAVSLVQGLYMVDIPITARTVTAFSRGVQYETRVRAQVKLRISKNLSVRDLRTWEDQIAKASLSTGSLSESISSDTTPDCTEDGKKPLLETDHERCTECGDFYNAKKASEAQIKDQPSPGDSDILIFLWGQGFKEWMNIVFLANPQASAKNYRISSFDNGPLSFKNIQLNADGSSGYPLMDRAENQIFRIGAELEISAKHGTRSQLHQEISGDLEASTGTVGLFYESDIQSIPSFTAIGPVNTLNGEGTDHTRGSQLEDILPRSSPSWTKAILQRVLRQLACSRYDFSEIIKINIHVGIEAVMGYDFREIKNIAKSIILFGGLLNGVGFGPNSGHHRYCLDPAERVLSNVKHIQAIDKASSIDDIAQLMNSLEASGYTYHGEACQESQRYDFNCLESQGVIIWIQIFSKLDEKEIINWISMILLFNRVVISKDSSMFAELAEKPITLSILNRFIANS